MNVQRLATAGYSSIGALATVLGYNLGSLVFILGTGRCGSSLLVRILDSHPDLKGFPGEANELWHPNSYPFSTRSIVTPAIVEDPGRFTELSLASWPPHHESKIVATFAGYKITRGLTRTLFVKSAMISFMLPKLVTLFPRAKFIHIYRNGPSVVASFLRKEWDKYSSYFADQDAYRLHCARYWNDCIWEIERQKEQLSLDRQDSFLEISYEELCGQSRVVLDRTAEFLSISAAGFEFDIGQIVNRNYKVGDVGREEAWVEPLRIMESGMGLKGYT